jgi:myo-inositol-1(or 4)-monophosphatase
MERYIINYNNWRELFNRCKFLIENNSKSVFEKRTKDIKLEIDHTLNREIEKYLVSATCLPVYSEEMDFPNNSFLNIRENKFWLIDPLDGSLNYFRGLPIYCCSIALFEDGECTEGIIFDFATENILRGIRGEGCFLNSQILKRPKQKDISESIMCTGIPSYLNNTIELRNFWNKLEQTERRVKKIRILGSAAYSIYLLALGIVDLYEEHRIAIWDIAAGKLIAEELGFSIESEFKNNFGYISIMNVTT